jgi:hypothetical protein
VSLDALLSALLEMLLVPVEVAALVDCSATPPDRDFVSQVRTRLQAPVINVSKYCLILATTTPRKASASIVGGGQFSFGPTISVSSLATGNLAPGASWVLAVFLAGVTLLGAVGMMQLA